MSSLSGLGRAAHDASFGADVVKAAKQRGLSLLPVQTHKNHPGLGIMAVLGGKEVHIGNRRFIQQAKIAIPSPVESRAIRDFVTGESLLYFAVDQELQGVFVVQDRLRPEAKLLLGRLRDHGIKRIILASGDLKVAAEHIAEQLGIQEVYSEQLPAEKLALVTRLKAEGLKVAMVGDGVNDAQALAAADLSIAMGGGHCDVAIEAADIALARNDLMLVADTLDISKRTLGTIYQNFAAAVGINMGGLIVSTFGTLSPFSAAIVHNASTIVVVLNSFRLGRQVAQIQPKSISQEVIA